MHQQSGECQPQFMLLGGFDIFRELGGNGRRTRGKQTQCSSFATFELEPSRAGQELVADRPATSLRRVFVSWSAQRAGHGWMFPLE